VVSRLVERGLAQRTASAEDGRRMEISITARGLELLRQAPRTAQIAMQEALLRMDADQVSALAAGLVVLVREGGFGDLAVPMFFEEDAAGNS
jgi:DNA-binding MarR family transcriptional regulator